MPFRVFERRRHENISFCRYFAFRGEDTTNKGRQHERFLPADTKFSTKKFSCIRLLKCRWLAGWPAGRPDGRTDGWMDGWMGDESMDGLMGGQSV